MLAVDIVVTLAAVVANIYAAFADFTKSQMSVANSKNVGVPLTWLPVLGTLKTAGAVGLVLGLLGAHLLGIAAATGLVLFFLGAIVTHLRAREHSFIFVTVGYLALAIAALIVALAR